MFLRLAGNLAALIARALTGTLRLVTLHPERLAAVRAAGQRPLYAFWHGRQLPLLGWEREAGCAVLVSHSRDGALQANVLSALGFVPERGSSARGGAAGLKALVRRVRAGHAAVFAVDGGRGPLHAVHEGVLALARLTGQPVVPVGCSVRRRKVLWRTWDRYLVPAPFSKGVVVVGEPLAVPGGAGRSVLAQLAGELGRRLHAVNAEADLACGAPPEPAAFGPDPCPVCAARLDGDPGGA